MQNSTTMEYGRSCHFLFATVIILLRMKLENLVEFTTVSIFVNEIKFTPWAKIHKQLLGAGGQ